MNTYRTISVIYCKYTRIYLNVLKIKQYTESDGISMKINIGNIKFVAKKLRLIFLSPTVGLCLLLAISLIISQVVPNVINATSNRLVPIYNVDRDDKYISLTVDAAWGNEYTDKIIEILDKYNVTITFFTVNFWAEEYPDDIEKLKLHGHEIGNHSANHPDMAKLSKEKIAEELLTTWETQKKYAGSSAVRLFRAPYGSYNNLLIETCHEYGFECIQWDVDSIDWKENADVDDVVKRVLTKTKSGSIILMHNNSSVITKVLPQVIEGLLDKGYTFVPVSQLIYKNNYTVDSNGTQHTSK